MSEKLNMFSFPDDDNFACPYSKEAMTATKWNQIGLELEKVGAADEAIEAFDSG
jgi:hypothetical protein